MVLWTERFLRHLNKVQDLYLDICPDDPYYLDLLERGIELCEQEIKSERARKAYEADKRACTERYEAELREVDRQMEAETDPLEKPLLARRREALRQRYLRSLLMALQRIARDFAMEAPEEA